MAKRKLSDIKDVHGTSLQSYAEDLMEKADAAGLRCMLLFIIEPDGLHTISNIQVEALPDALSQIAAQMRKKPKSSARLENQLRRMEPELEN